LYICSPPDGIVFVCEQQILYQIEGCFSNVRKILYVIEQGDITGGAALIIYYSSPGFACPTLAGVARLASRAGGGRLAGIG
jgi:hypothetical protein